MSDDAVKPIKGESGGNTIIVVEPDVLARIVLGEYLREYGYKVLECANAEDVLIILSAGRKIDAVLCEMELTGGLNGFALARQLCDEGPLDRRYHPKDVVRRLNRLRDRRRRTQS